MTLLIFKLLLYVVKIRCNNNHIVLTAVSETSIIKDIYVSLKIYIKPLWYCVFLFKKYSKFYECNMFMVPHPFSLSSFWLPGFLTCSIFNSFTGHFSIKQCSLAYVRQLLFVYKISHCSNSESVSHCDSAESTETRLL